MRLIGVVLACLLLSAGTVKAQSAIGNDLLPDAPTPSINQIVATPLISGALHGALLSSMRPEPAPAPAPQTVQGIYPELYWQASFGYTYMRFYELPGVRVNTNGFNVSMAYFFKPWMAAEGELDGGVGSQNGQTAKSVFSGGGLRMRMAGPGGTEFWIHGVVGGAHFSPETTYGGTGAFGYEAGGGVDLRPRSERFSYRIAADLVGTSFFGTYQISPKLSAGVVYKF